jgi:hypothetical protein
MKQRYIFVFICICIVGSCDHVNNVKQIELINHEKTHENIFIEYGGLMASFENRLIGLEAIGSKPFYYLDYKEPDQLHRFGEKGSGPTDFIMPFSLQYINEETFGIYDVAAKSFTELALPEKNKEIAIKKKIQVENKMAFHLIKTAYNQYIGIGAYEEGMFLLMDSIGNTLSYFFDYPYKDKDEQQISNRLRAMAYQGNFIPNRKGDCFVYACNTGDILHFYKVKKDTIELVKKEDKMYPIYKTEERDGGFGAPMSRENKIGYISGDATDKYVYLLRGNQSFEYFLSEKKENDTGNFGIYNWEGILIKEIKLDIPCRSICVTPDNKRIWAIANIPEPSLVFFNLPELF